MNGDATWLGQGPFAAPDSCVAHRPFDHREFDGPFVVPESGETEPTLRAATPPGLRGGRSDVAQLSAGQTAPPGPAAGSPPAHIDDVIRGWDQYKDEVALLPQGEKDKITRIAEAIAISFTTPGRVPLGRIVIIGHADKDFHGAAFEERISEERAKSVAAALGQAIVAALKARKIRRLAPGAIAFDPKFTGVGATQPDPAARGDRTLNRRVEIHVLERGAPIPISEPDTLKKRVERALQLLETHGFKGDSTGKRKVRARCLLSKMLRPDLVDMFVDGTQRNRRIGSQNVPGFTAGFSGRYDGSPNAATPGPPLPDSEFIKLLDRVSPLLNSPGWLPTQPDAQILEFLDVVVLEKIYTGILRVERYLTVSVNLITGRYDGDRARIRCKALYTQHFDDQNNIYSCWKGYTGGEDSHI